MKTESLGGFDRFRVPAALLVIAIHTGPLLSLNGEANYLLTDILARIAVPFFFSVSGWFLVPRLLREGRAALIPFVKKLLLLYGAAVLLYLTWDTSSSRSSGVLFLLKFLCFSASGPRLSSALTHSLTLSRKDLSLTPSGVSGHFPSRYSSTHFLLYSYVYRIIIPPLLGVQ